MFERFKIALSLTVFVYCFASCSGASASSSNSPGQTAGSQAAGNKSASASNPGLNSANGIVSGTCHTDDPNHMCLALDYVVYEDSSKQNNPVVTQAQAISNLGTINKLYSTCNISFQIDTYKPVVPKDFNLAFNTANTDNLDAIRKDFMDDKTLLVVTTGKWDRTGSLGDTGANAWTAMPGENLYGAILENTVGTFGNIIAHELGHYLNLDHVSDESNLMNPIIYDDSTTLTENQCSTMRSAVTDYWQKMLR